MIVRLLLAVALSVAFHATGHACSVTGCEPDEGKMPTLRFRLLDGLGVQMSVFDSETDAVLTLPNFLRTELSDGSLVVEYLGHDRREVYGDATQYISVQFADLVLPEKHPEGRVDRVPVGGSGEIVNWTGRATFLTVSGALESAEALMLCGWFCQLDIEWVGSFPDAHPSFSRVKALYRS